MRLSRGVTLALVGLLVLSSTLAVSAATAPDRSVSAAQPAPTETDAAGQPTTETGQSTTETGQSTTDTGQATEASRSGGPHVLVGSQGGGTNWQKQGSVYRLDDQEVVWKINDRDSYFDATMMENGNVVAGFMHNGYETGCGPYEPPCTKTGYRVLDPSNGSTPEVVSEYLFPIRGPTHSELHDVEPMGDGRFVFADMEYERIAVVSNGSIEWQWNASDSGFYDAPPDVTRRDWLHINDVDHIGDNRFLVSVRNANQLLVIERGEGVVEVINEDTGGRDASCTKGGQLADFDDDGDVRCGSPDVLNHQHNPQWLGEGRVLVADSENDRVVELHRADDGTWQEGWTLERAGGLVLQWPRDADRLSNGNTLVTDSLNRRVFEVTPGGDVVWSYGTPLIPYEADPLPGGEVAGGFATTADADSTATDAGAETETDTNTTTGTNTDDESTSSTAPAAAGRNDGFSAADIPGLSLGLVGIKAVVPRLPIWFGEFQLLVTVLSLGLVGVGLVDHRRR